MQQGPAIIRKGSLASTLIFPIFIAIISFVQYQEQLKSSPASTNNNRIKNAYKLMPSFVPITLAYANMLIKKNKVRKAVKILENAWSALPHPDIAACYMEIYANDTDEKRIEKAERLLHLSSQHPEGHISVAREALSAGQYGKARHHLKTSLGFGETMAICHLMAELEGMEKAKHEVIHYWRERALIANNLSIWKCNNCGTKSHKWHITCHNCGSFDSMEWQDVQVLLHTTEQPSKLLGNG